MVTEKISALKNQVKIVSKSYLECFMWLYCVSVGVLTVFAVSSCRTLVQVFPVQFIRSCTTWPGGSEQTC